MPSRCSNPSGPTGLNITDSVKLQSNGFADGDLDKVCIRIALIQPKQEAVNFKSEKIWGLD
jgi:hypothetical protein